VIIGVLAGGFYIALTKLVSPEKSAYEKARDEKKKKKTSQSPKKRWWIVFIIPIYLFLVAVLSSRIIYPL